MNSLFNFAFVKEQLKRFWAIGALSFIIYLLGCILPLLSLNSLRPSRDSISDFMINILQMGHPALIVLAVLVPLITVASMFSFMYQSNSTAALHSLPLRKRTIFASNFLAGFILIAVPLLLLCVLLALEPVAFSNSVIQDNGNYVQIPYEPNMFFPAGIQTYEVINTIPALFFFFIRMLISFMFYFCLFILASALAGSQVFYLLLCIILPFVPAALYSVYGIISNIFVFGFYFSLTPFARIFLYTSPLITPMAAELQVGLEGIYTFYILLTLLLLALSVYLFHTRRQERAGEGLVFDKFRAVFIFFCSVGAMMLGGAFFFSLWDHTIFLYLGALIGFVMGHIIARMLSERTFNIFKNFRPFVRHLAVIALCFLAVLLIVSTDLTGYSSRVPAETEVAAVYFRNPDSYDIRYNDMDKRLIKEPDIIKQTVATHSAIIENKGQAYSLFSGNLLPQYSFSLLSNSHVIYQLNDGSYLKRYYRIPDSLAAESGLSALLKEEEVILSDYYWLNEPENIESVNVYVYDNRDHTDTIAYEKFSTEPSLISSTEDITSFFTAVRQDYVEEVQSDLLHQTELSINIEVVMKEVPENRSDHVEREYLNLSVGKNVLPWLDNFN